MLSCGEERYDTVRGEQAGMSDYHAYKSTSGGSGSSGSGCSGGCFGWFVVAFLIYMFVIFCTKGADAQTLLGLISLIAALIGKLLS